MDGGIHQTFSKKGISDMTSGIYSMYKIWIWPVWYDYGSIASNKGQSVVSNVNYVMKKGSRMNEF